MRTSAYTLRDLCREADSLRLPRPLPAAGLRVNILALGDVGATLLLGLRLLGGGLLDRIGIWDMDEKVCARYEMEMGQIGWAFPRASDGEAPASRLLPRVVCVTEGELFDCDLFLFCASRGVPPVGATGDVRMMQLSANRPLVEKYAAMAGAAGFNGIFGVVSDPVDPLCKAALTAGGLMPGQVRGFGLGVMHRRALYFAARDPRFARYAEEGRAYGPHGQDLVLADSITDYDEETSLALTRQTVEANQAVRALGFKPYLAPAISSGAMSVIDLLTGRWHYSSVYVGRGADGAFLGQKNRLQGADTVTEADLPLPAPLYRRIERAYETLRTMPL